MENHEFEIFVRRCRGAMLTTARRYVSTVEEAEDIVQDALLKLYAIRHRLDISKGIDALATVVVRNMAIDTLRHNDRHPVIPLRHDATNEEDAEHDERITQIMRLIEELPSKQQIVLRMKHIEEMEVEEIAELMQMSVDAIYQNLSRARRAILKQFKNNAL